MNHSAAAARVGLFNHEERKDHKERRWDRNLEILTKPNEVAGANAGRAWAVGFRR